MVAGEQRQVTACTLVERASRCFLGYEMTYGRESARLQLLLNRSPSAQ
jgi:hypothetical protein